MTLIEAARTMLADSLLPVTFWAQAANTACYVLNRALVIKTHNKTPYELLNGRSHRLDFMRLFGCPVTILNTLDPLGKFEGKADEGFLEMSNQDYIVLPLWSSISSTYKSSNDKPIDDKPKDDTGSKTIEEPVNKEDQAYRDKLDRIMSQEKEASNATNTLRKEFEQGCIDQRGVTQAGSTNSFNTETAKLQSTGIFNSAYDDDLDIYTSPVQSVGAEADFNNMESSTIVSPIPTHKVHIDHPKDQILGYPKSAVQTKGMAKKSSRAHALMEPKKISQSLNDESWVRAMQEEIEAIKVFLAFASFMRFIVYQIDVKSAFLYGTIEEEVYVSQSPSFIDSQFPNKVYMVEKAFYGLHQALRAWFKTLSTFLLQNGYRRGTINKNLFIKKDKDDVMLVQVYVDDIIFGSTKKSLCDEFEALMHKRFQMSSVGELTFFLGLEYTNRDSKAIGKDEVAADVLGLKYPRDSPFDLEAYSDKDCAEANLDRKSTTGGCQFLGRRLISWQCKKQTIVATSTIKAEYVVVAHCCGQTEENTEFHQIVDFLSTYSINYAFTVSPTIYASYIEQFWNNAVSKIVNSVKQIHAIVDGKVVVISESSVRSDLLFNDEDGNDCLTNSKVFENLALMRYEQIFTKLTFQKGSFSP
nr:retrovirus-related Pol polyprotein from transposon TNT 1-94 [Tanacetum cinerariifolium]